VKTDFDRHIRRRIITMSLQVEKLEKNMAKLTIEVSAEEFEKAVQNAYMKQKKNISLPGFRKGKVPRKMIEKMYGTGVFYDDAANAIIPGAYSEAVAECDLDIVSHPQIDVVQVESGKAFIFTAEVATKPEVTLGEYKGLEVDKYSNRVSAKEIDAEIEKEQQKNARTVVVEDRAVQDGDEVVLDFEGFVDGVAFEGGKGENYPLTIGSGSFIPGFEEQLVGVEAEKEVEVNVTFPEDYHAEDLKGKEAVFKCTVHEIKAKELPEIDDEFASEVSEFDTLEEYKADVKAKIKEQKISEGKRKQEDQAVEKAIENAQMEIPEAMIDTQVDQMKNEFAQRLQSQGIDMQQYMMFTGMTEEKMMEELQPQAVKRIQTRLVLEAIAKAENIEISDERLDEEIQKMAEAYNMEADKLKEYMGEEEKKQMKEDIAVQEAVTLITEAAVEK
jgi:trigger factor